LSDSIRERHENALNSIDLKLTARQALREKAQTGEEWHQPARTGRSIRRNKAESGTHRARRRI